MPVRDAGIGRRLARLAAEKGFTVPTVIGGTPVFRDVHVADSNAPLGELSRPGLHQRPCGGNLLHRTEATITAHVTQILATL